MEGMTLYRVCFSNTRNISLPFGQQPCLQAIGLALPIP
jgi:hypothetical protein